jgi:hypothetical protein
MKPSPTDEDARLDLRIPGTPGRRRSLTAKAFVRKRGKQGIYQSHVVIMGVTRVLSTQTKSLAAAQEFNRLHLLRNLRQPRTS